MPATGQLHNAEPAAQRLLSMEGLRGLAVLLVFLVHYYALFGFLLAGSPIQSQICLFAARMGHSGVDLFFVMSGFLIYGAALKPGLNYFTFMKRRIVRIYPAFLAVFAVYLFLSYRFPTYSRIPSDPLQAGLYIGENFLLLPGMLAITPIITVSWSLSYEMFYYLCLPAVALATKLALWTQVRRLVVIGFASLLFFLAGCLGWENHVQLLMFFGGMLLYELKTSERLQNFFSPRRELLAAILFFVSLPLSALALSYSFRLRTLLLFVGFVPFALFCFRFDGPIAKWFRWRPLRAWGNISYSYYLAHGLILNCLLYVWPKSVHTSYAYWLFLPFALLATITGSFALFALVERPLSLKAPAKKRSENVHAPVPQRARTVANPVAIEG